MAAWGGIAKRNGRTELRIEGAGAGKFARREQGHCSESEGRRKATQDASDSHRVPPVGLGTGLR